MQVLKSKIPKIKLQAWKPQKENTQQVWLKKRTEKK